MFMQDYDAEGYRENPKAFFRLPENQRLRILDEICGEGNFVFRRDPVRPTRLFEDIFSGENAFTYNECLTVGDWNTAAKLLYFFSIPFKQFTNFEDDAALADFAQHFPFGCFASSHDAFDNDIFHGHALATLWCLGVLSVDEIVTQLLWKVAEDVFQRALKQLSTMKYLRNTLAQSLQVVGSLVSSRKTTRGPHLLQTLSQLTSLPSGFHIDEVIYPCMMPFYYDWMSEYPACPRLPRPKWSPARHLQLTAPEPFCRLSSQPSDFRAIAQTILLMQRFRWVNFPLAKDLRHLVLGFVFDAHVALLEEQLEQRSRRVQLSAATLDDQAEQTMLARGLAQGILCHPDWISYNLLNMRSDILDLEAGIPLPPSRAAIYEDDFGNYLNSEYYDVLLAQLPPDLAEKYHPDEEDGISDEISLMRLFLKWAAQEKFDLSLVYRPTRKLSEDEIASFSAFAREKMDLYYAEQLAYRAIRTPEPSRN